jgi:hypothetical protein
MEFLEFEELSFHPDANVGHLCNNVNNTIVIGNWYDTYQVQNTKWLWLVNNVVAVLNSYNMHCGCIGQYASYVAGILNLVKEINFCFFVIKGYIAQTTLKCMFNTQCSISFKSHTNNHFVLTTGEEGLLQHFNQDFYMKTSIVTNV